MQTPQAMKAPDDRVWGVMVDETTKSVWFAFVSLQPEDPLASTVVSESAGAAIPSAHITVFAP